MRLNPHLLTHLKPQLCLKLAEKLQEELLRLKKTGHTLLGVKLSSDGDRLIALVLRYADQLVESGEQIHKEASQEIKEFHKGHCNRPEDEVCSNNFTRVVLQEIGRLSRQKIRLLREAEGRMN